MKSRLGRRASSSRAPLGVRSLRGRVTSGRGIAARALAELKPRIRQETGARIVDGSLNVILSRPVRLRESTALSIEDGKRKFWPASVSGSPVWIYRWVGAPEHIIELVAERHLRSAMHLRDGDTIWICLSSKDVAPMSSVRRLVWAMLWIGRKNWYYTKDDYLRRVSAIKRRAVALRNGFFHVIQITLRIRSRHGVSALGEYEAREPDAHEFGHILPDDTDESAGRSVK